jgi:pimeloyl-ACP methyl ester carboxylesterase
VAEVRTATGRTTHYDVTGDGPPLLLIVGHLVARKAWDEVAPVFARAYRVIRIDNRDAGENAPETAPYTIADMAGDVAALLDALDIPRANVVGHSMGVSTALRFVLDDPARVDHLVLVSGRAAEPTPDGQPHPITPPARDTWIADPTERARRRSVAVVGPGYFDTHPDRLETVVAQERGNRITYEGMVRQLQAMAAEVARPYLGEIGAPTLVIHGERDPLVSPRYGEILAAEISGARLIVMPGVGHRPFVEQRDEFVTVVMDFLREA